MPAGDRAITTRGSHGVFKKSEHGPMTSHTPLEATVANQKQAFRRDGYVAPSNVHRGLRGSGDSSE